MLLVLALCVPIVISSFSSLSSQLVQECRLRLESGSIALSKEMEQLQIQAHAAGLNGDFLTLCSVKGKLPASSAWTMNRANVAFNRISQMGSFASYVFILFPQNDFFFDSYRCSSDFSSFSDHFLGFLKNGNELDGEKIRELVTEAKFSPLFVPLDCFSFLGKNDVQDQVENACLFIVPVCDQNTFETMADVVFVLDPLVIRSELLPEDNRDSYRLTVQDQGMGTVLLANGKQDEHISSSWKSISIINDALGWKITASFPFSLIQDRMQPVTKLIFGYGIIGILLVLFLSILLGKREYGNLLELYKATDSVLPVSSRNTDAFRHVVELVRLNYRSVGEFRDHLLQMETLNRSIRLENIVVGGSITPDQEEMIQSQFPGGRIEFYCILIIRSVGKDFSGDTLHNSLVVDLLKTAGICFLSFPRANNDVVFLVSWNKSEKEFSDTITSCLQSNREILDHPCHGGISNLVHDLAQVGLCYDQARRALDSISSSLDEMLIVRYALPADFIRLDGEELLFHDRLQQALFSGDSQVSCSILQDMCGIYRKETAYFAVQKRQIFSGIFAIYYHTFIRCAMPVSAIENLPSYSENLTVDDLFTAFSKSAQQLCMYLENRRKSAKERQKEDVADYLRNHYPDYDLSSEKVCQVMSISKYALNRYMQEVYGESFATALERIRIENAAKMLQETDYANLRIAHEVGFAALNTFYRVFIKRMGTTPKEYKRRFEENETSER